MYIHVHTNCTIILISTLTPLIKNISYFRQNIYNPWNIKELLRIWNKPCEGHGRMFS